jgi:large subunit ribosomal protein L25
MKKFQLEGSVRELVGKKPTKATRANDNVPCVLYGGSENFHFEVASNKVRKLIYTSEVFIVELSIDGKKINAIMKDLQFHPVSDKVLHIDFLEVFEKKPIVISIPVKLNGLAEGVKLGGKLIQEMRTIKVKSTYDQIPEFVEVDVTDVELGKSIQVGTLSFPDLEVLSPSMNIICSVKLTRAAKGMAAGGETGTAEGVVESAEGDQSEDAEKSE